MKENAAQQNNTSGNESPHTSPSPRPTIRAVTQVPMKSSFIKDMGIGDLDLDGTAEALTLFAHYFRSCDVSGNFTIESA